MMDWKISSSGEIFGEALGGIAAGSLRRGGVAVPEKKPRDVIDAAEPQPLDKSQSG